MASQWRWQRAEPSQVGAAPQTGPDRQADAWSLRAGRWAVPRAGPALKSSQVASWQASRHWQRALRWGRTALLARGGQVLWLMMSLSVRVAVWPLAVSSQQPSPGWRRCWLAQAPPCSSLHQADSTSVSLPQEQLGADLQASCITLASASQGCNSPNKLTQCLRHELRGTQV